ncbi:MAG TPA: hypothetical protein VMM16_15805 [Verrucomicrobiae bacterium]|nr:hypothetical protein [Verrucomicrobiae bacterium]
MCAETGCSQDAILLLDGRSFCAEHLVSHCYSRLQECEQGEGSPRSTAEAAMSGDTAFLDECRTKLASLLVVYTRLTNIERARVLDILLWASELSEKQREQRPGRATAAGMFGE